MQYTDGKFLPHEAAAALATGDIVECLFPFTGPASGHSKDKPQPEKPLPKMIELVARAECEVMLAAGDPDNDGLWPQATPTILAALPTMLARTQQAVSPFAIHTFANHLKCIRAQQCNEPLNFFFSN